MQVLIDWFLLQAGYYHNGSKVSYLIPSYLLNCFFLTRKVDLHIFILLFIWHFKKDCKSTVLIKKSVEKIIISNYPVPAVGVDSSVVAIMMLSRYFPNTNWGGRMMKQMLYTLMLLPNLVRFTLKII